MSVYPSEDRRPPVHGREGRRLNSTPVLVALLASQNNYSVMEFILIAIVALFSAILTFFSGFGLGTILMVVFAIFFPVEIAIALTALVHLANNIFKLTLIWKLINRKVFIKFAIPAMAAAFLGAVVLNVISREIIIFIYNIGERTYHVTLLRLVISFLLIIFAILELHKRFENFSMGKKYLPLGGALSGFFGGLSGHQGAFRSMFLLRSGLNKEGFIATGIAAATLIDVSRVAVYGTSFFADYIAMADTGTQLLLATAIIAAFAGSLMARKFLVKVKMKWVRKIVGYMILVLAILLGLGII